MDNFTTNTYEIKRDIYNFSQKIYKNSSKPVNKFVTDMIYGILKSKDVLLSSIARALNETTKKAMYLNRLSDNLALNLDKSIDKNYCNLVMKNWGKNPVFLIDDSDIIKPLGEKFENLGIVRYGSSKNKSYAKGYHYTEIVAITQNKKQPISVFYEIHSSNSRRRKGMYSKCYKRANSCKSTSEKIGKRGFIDKIIKEPKSLKSKAIL